MHWIAKTGITGILFLSVCCEKLPVIDLTNSLDLVHADENGVIMPALVFYPDSVIVEKGASFLLEIHAMVVDSISGAQFQVKFDPNYFSILNAEAGTIFSGTTSPLFFFTSDTSKGTVEIITANMGIDSLKSVSGTGQLAKIELEVIRDGHNTIEFSNDSRFVDAFDRTITINSFLTAKIFAN